jgi:tRNA (guanine-N7-)-methyltransferase
VTGRDPEQPAGDERPGAAAHPHIRSFAMRRGRVTLAQRRAFDAVLPRLAIDYRPALLDIDASFARAAPTVLEIGFGMGETTAAIAQARPDVNFLAVEVYAAGVGALAMRVDRLRLANVRIVRHDAVEVVRDMIAPAALAGVHVFFPDPWPKARHHKRRLIAPPFVALLAARIAPGGYLHCATDWRHYAEQMLAVLTAEPLLANLHPDFAPSPANPLAARPTTKFDARGQQLGHGTWDLVFVRR